MRNMIKIKYTLKIHILVLLCFSCFKVKSQSNVIFPVIEHNNDQLDKVFFKEITEVNSSIFNLDAVVSFEKADSTLNIFYMGRDLLYDYLLGNSKEILGVQIKGRIIGVHKSAEKLLDIKPEVVVASKIFIKRRKLNKNKELIDFPSPTDYKHSVYKLDNSKFRLIERDFTHVQEL